jgi:CheY-like chemotaxis protein/HPt (histidine-containing phosphotransfer) domain-containing protein
VRLALLVVDDVEINRMVARAILERMGHDVTCAGSGGEALELLATQVFDVVFMDIQMPEMDGLQTTAAIRERERRLGGRHIPVIAMTAYAMASDRDRCLAAGMDGYVSKPVKPEKIREALEQFSGVPFKSDEASAQTVLGAPAIIVEEVVAPQVLDVAPVIPVFDRAGLAERLGGEDLVDIFLNKFRAGMPGYLDKLRSELDSGRADAVRAEAHAIKGLAANIGAEQVRQAALDIEMAAKAGDLEHLEALWSCMTKVYEIFVIETAPDATA